MLPFSRWLSQNKGYMRQTLVCCAVSTLSLVYGMLQAWPSLAIERLRNGAAGFKVTSDDISIIVSMITLGMFLTPILFGCVLVKLGRKTNFLLNAVMYIVAWALIVFAQSPVWLIAANFAAGFGGGIVLIIGPIYIAEIADKRIRGALTCVYVTAISAGSIFMTSAGIYIPYFELNCIELVLATLSLLCIIFFTVESPSWHLMQNDDKKAERSFRYYWSSSIGASADDIQMSVALAELKETVQAEMNSVCSYRELFGTPSNVQASITVIALSIFQGASGCIAVATYGSSTLPKYNGFWQPNPTMALYTILSVVFLIFSTGLIDKVGRKPLSIISNAGDALGTGMVATYFFIDRYTSLDTTDIKWLPYIGILVYISFFSSGMAAIPHILAGELFPVNVRYHASVVSVCCIAGTCFLLNFVYLGVSQYIGFCGMYLFFTMCSIAATVFSCCSMYETKNLSLAEIQLKSMRKRSSQAF